MIGHYLLFDGTCSEALEAYKDAFDGEITELQRYGDMPPNPDFPIAEEERTLVLNSRLRIDGTEIMCADSSHGVARSDNMYVSVMLDAVSIEKAWDILAEDGTVYRELQPTFFSPSHGSLQDRFGVNWMFTAMQP